MNQFCTRNLTRNRGARVQLAGIAFCAVLTGCMSVPRLAVQAERYRIDVHIDPSTHTLQGHAVLDVRRIDDTPLTPGRPVQVELLLHPDLKVKSVSASGATARYGGSTRQRPSADDEFVPRKHRVIIDRPAAAFSLFVDYEGKLVQDVAAGERPGEIHNFKMRAHVGNEGIYLAGGNWYPEPSLGVDETAALADYVLITDEVPNQKLVAGAAFDLDSSDETGRLVWRSPYPMYGLVLVGGPHEVFRMPYQGIDISLHLKESQEQHVDGLFEAVRRNLDRYQPLIGPYPAAEFSIVDNFFSSGFAFPTFTLLASAVIDMGERSQTAHGYIDHEMLHCWWGNGVLVDPDDGNWCEALASYGANYYGHVLDGAPDEARRKRRNYSHFLSRISPEKDKPLGTYGLDDGCSRGIAYNKGAAVFHMLAMKMGQDRFWEAMRRMTELRVGTYTSWDNIKSLCEEVAGQSLETFFAQWIRGGGAPTISIESAVFNSAEQTVTLTIRQEEPYFEVDLPIRIQHAGGTLDLTIPVSHEVDEATLSVNVIPTSIEIDPDYHLFRKIAESDIVPTTAATRRGKAFVSVVPIGEVASNYQSLRSIFEGSFEDNERIARTAGEIEEGALAKRCVLILGEAVRDAQVAGFLSALQFPVRFTDSGFEFQGVSYDEPGHAVLCTISHPDVEGGGVTVVFANCDSAIPPAFNIPMYDRSLVVFKDKRPIVRHDFEERITVPVDH